MIAVFLAANVQDRTIPILAVTQATLAERLAALSPAARAFATAAGFDGAAGQHVLLPGDDGIAAVLFGVAEGAGPSLALGKLPPLLPSGSYHLGSGFADIETATLAWGLGSYQYRRYKTAHASGANGASKIVARLKLDASLDADALVREVEAVWLARDLVNMPANDLGPADLSHAVRNAVTPYYAEVIEIVGDGLRTAFPLIHAVGAGSDRPPRLIDVTWGIHPTLRSRSSARASSSTPAASTSSRTPACC